jgi:hypothetical protein
MGFHHAVAQLPKSGITYSSDLVLVHLQCNRNSPSNPNDYVTCA